MTEIQQISVGQIHSTQIRTYKAWKQCNNNAMENLM